MVFPLNPGTMGSPYAKLSQNRYKHKCKTKYKIWGKKNLCDFGCDNDFFLNTTKSMSHEIKN